MSRENKLLRLKEKRLEDVSQIINTLSFLSLPTMKLLRISTQRWHRLKLTPLLFPKLQVTQNFLIMIEVIDVTAFP